MTPPARYSASPLPSYATRQDGWPVGFSDALRDILIWLRLLRPPTATLRRLLAEERLVEKLAEALAEEDQAQTTTTPAPEGEGKRHVQRRASRA